MPYSGIGNVQFSFDGVPNSIKLTGFNPFNPNRDETMSTANMRIYFAIVQVPFSQFPYNFRNSVDRPHPIKRKYSLNYHLIDLFIGKMSHYFHLQDVVKHPETER